ncbi:hypothetical protein EON83_24150 [bacterium]|nr:MAG: hypothetical protein EON83_24150 [bacterium]
MNPQSVLRRTAFAGVFLLGCAMTQRANAATFTVSNTNDSGAGSLRQAVLDANATPGADNILFAPTLFSVPQTIVLTTGELAVSGSGGALTIAGPNAAKLTLDANNNSRIFKLNPGSNVILSSLVFTNATGTGNGGAISSESSTLAVYDSTFTGNKTLNGGSGAAIFNLDGPLTIDKCLFSANTANALITSDGSGGGTAGAIANLAYGGRSSESALLTINSSTFVGNESRQGGAIHNNSGKVVVNNSTIVRNRVVESQGFGGAVSTVFGPVSLNSCTITANVADRGSAVAVFDATASLDLNNSIVVNNTTLSGGSDPFFGPIASGDYNLFEYTATGRPGTHNVVSTAPKLGELADNGGPTQTIALLPGSPAIDAGSTSLATDQRGIARPQRRAADIGAVEIVNTPPRFRFLRLEPLAPDTDGTMAAYPEAIDVDGDPLTFNYVWRKNGVVIEGESGSTLDLSKPGNGDDNDAITVTVTVSDGFATGEPISSGVVYVNNHMPSVYLYAPQNGTDKVGTKRTFTLEMHDHDGAGDIQEGWLLINDRLSWNAGATLIYVPDVGTPTNGLLYLRRGDAFLPAMRIGEGATAGAVLDNGAVRVIGSEVSVSIGSDINKLFVSLPLTIREGLVGQNRLFARVVDRKGVLDISAAEGDSGYRRFGNYTVLPQFAGETNSIPTLSKLNPTNTNTVLNSAGIAPAAQNFGFFVKDDDGWGDIDNVWFLAGQVRSFRGTANFVFYPRTRRLFLRSDDGSTLLGGGVIGTAGVLENSQVRLDLSKVKMTIIDGKSFGLTLPIQAKNRLFGSNKVWLRVQDKQNATAPNGDEQGYVQSGAWNVGRATTPGTLGVLSSARS